MINTREIMETIKMIDDQHLDIRTITAKRVAHIANKTSLAQIILL